MEDLVSWFVALGSCFGCFGFFPLILALAATVDAMRVGADWYWYLVILFFPVVGPVAYFAVVRGPWSGQRLATLSPVAMRRKQARRRLREIEAQLTHWRGPVLLAEAGEELFVLGRWDKAERYLREAYEAEGPVEEVNLRYAQVLAAAGRYREAVPIVDELVAVEPDARLGEARLHLARCLDEAGEAERAEEVLREVLVRRQPLEAKVRLARLLLRAGRGEEAAELRREVAADAAVMPRYLKRRHGAWMRAGRRLRTGRETLPRYRGPLPSRPRLRGVLAAVVLVLLALMLVAALLAQVMRERVVSTMVSGHFAGEEARAELVRLRQLHPWTLGDDLAAVDLTAAAVDRYLRVRYALADASATFAAQHRRATGGFTPPALAPVPVDQRAVNESIGSVPDLVAADAAYTRAVADELAAAGLGPDELANLIAMIEWRFLGRPEALRYGLPSDRTAAWILTVRELASASYTLAAAELDAAARAELTRRQAAARDRRRELELSAREATALSPATRELLETSRSELAALPADDLRTLLHVLDSEQAWLLDQELEWADRAME